MSPTLRRVAITAVIATGWLLMATGFTLEIGWPLWAIPVVWIGLPLLLIGIGLALGGRR